MLDVATLQGFLSPSGEFYECDTYGHCELAKQIIKSMNRYSVDAIKTMFKIDKDAYKDRMNNFITKVIKNPLEELNSVNKNFQISYQKVMENHKTVAFNFTCVQTEILKIAKTDSPEEINEKEEINSELMEINYFKEKYPKEWKEAEEIINSQQELPFDFGNLNDFRILEKLKELGLE